MIYIEMDKLIRLGHWYTVLGTCIVGLSWAMLVCLPNGLWAQRKADFGMVTRRSDGGGAVNEILLVI